MTPTLRRVLVLVLTLGPILAQTQISYPPLDPAERTQWFRDAKFGLFIHWGPYSVIGRHEWARDRFQIPQAEYDRYARSFNPVQFDADAWVDLAKRAGTRYMVITSKHHDGFSIYRSRASNYDMEITPYDGDPLKLLADACLRKRMRLGFYYSIMDWHHPDYRPRRAWESADPKSGGNLDRYLEFAKAQLRELLTGYGEVATLWFDGEWEHTTAELHSDEIYDLIRSLQPNTLINDRLFRRQPGSRADYGTPEQFVPATGVRDPSGKPLLWESCVTINADSWGYNKYETRFKSSRELIRMLIDVVSKGGNLLLNVGPMPDGRIQPEFVTRLEAMGAWLRTNGEAIYGTSSSPFARLPFFGRATVRGNQLYLLVFEWPHDGNLRLPGLQNLVHSARLVGVPGSSLPVHRLAGEVVVKLPSRAPDEVASAVEVTLDGPPTVQAYRIQPDANGVITAGAESSQTESRARKPAMQRDNFLGHVFVTNWLHPDDFPSWDITIPQAGRYRVVVRYASGRGTEGVPFTVTAGAGRVGGKVVNTGNDLLFKEFQLGNLRLSKGQQTLRVESGAREGQELMRLEEVRLVPE